MYADGRLAGMFGVVASCGTHSRLLRHRPAPYALPLAIEAMSEPMVSHDCVVLAAVGGRAAERKVVQSG